MRAMIFEGSAGPCARPSARSRVRDPVSSCCVQTRVTVYPLHAAGEALEDLRSGRFTGAAVLKP